MFGVISADSSNQDGIGKDPRTSARLQLQEQAIKSGIMVNSGSNSSNNHSSTASTSVSPSSSVSQGPGCFGEFLPFTSLPKLAPSQPHPPLSTSANPNTTSLWRLTAVVTRRFAPKESSFVGASGAASKSVAIRLWDPVTNPMSAGICESSTSPRNVFLLIIAGQAFEKWYSHLVPRTVLVLGTVGSTSGMIVEQIGAESSSSRGGGGGGSQSSYTALTAKDALSGHMTSASVKIVIKDPSDICTIGFSDNIVPCGMMTGLKSNDASSGTCETFVNKLRAKACLKHVVQAKKMETAHRIQQQQQHQQQGGGSGSALMGANPASPAAHQSAQQLPVKVAAASSSSSASVSLFASHANRQAQQQKLKKNLGNNTLIPLVQRDTATGAPVAALHAHGAGGALIHNSISNSDIANFQLNNPYSTATGFTPSAAMTRDVRSHAFVNPHNTSQQQQQQQQRDDHHSNLPSPLPPQQSLIVGTGTNLQPQQHQQVPKNHFSALIAQRTLQQTSPVVAVVVANNTSAEVQQHQHQQQHPHLQQQVQQQQQPRAELQMQLLLRPTQKQQSVVGRTLEAAAVESRRRQREEEEEALQKIKLKDQQDQMIKIKQQQQQQFMRETKNQKLIFSNPTSTSAAPVPPSIGRATDNHSNSDCGSSAAVLQQQQLQRQRLQHLRQVPAVPPVKQVFTPLIDATTGARTAAQLLQQQPASSSSSSKSALAASLGLPTNYQTLSRAATSKNDDLAQQARKEEVSEKLRKIDERAALFDALDNVTEVQARAYRCPVCQRTTFSRQKICVDKEHPVVVVETVKRFYRCGKCKNGRLPGVGEAIPVQTPCSLCGASCWERTTAAGGAGAQEIRPDV